ncbi:hypothetical protein [Lentzea jiangxiensis]|uniref:Uncharacterized protein n=1 Tax=Lentzea jiangxiensis TaxID=641025 RepID=A0A1H0VNQ8_9PSEU|nr:hypothetical protein [Lentzea jiangxiensis]SDP80232.1 hypothetical protein SAMN05421507_11539 [Lentzea jiangxiensis]
MSVVVLVLLLAVVMTALGVMAAMVVAQEPFYGVVGLFIICGPSSLLAVLHLAVA